MEILYETFSILLLLFILFVIVLLITTLSLYNETRPKNIKFLIELASAIKNNDRLKNYELIYNTIISNIPNNISYDKAVEILTVRVGDNYIPNSEIADLLKKLHSLYIKFDTSKLFTSLLDKYLENTVITDKEIKIIIKAA